MYRLLRTSERLLLKRCCSWSSAAAAYLFLVDTRVQSVSVPSTRTRWPRGHGSLVEETPPRAESKHLQSVARTVASLRPAARREARSVFCYIFILPFYCSPLTSTGIDNPVRVVQRWRGGWPFAAVGQFGPAGRRDIGRTSHRAHTSDGVLRCPPRNVPSLRM